MAKKRIAEIILCTAVLVAGSAVPLLAETGGQVVGFAGAALVENPSSVGDLPREYQDTDDNDMFGGFEGEIWFDRFGFGLRHAGRFEQREVEVVDEDDLPATTSTRDAWWYDGRTDLFAAFHFFDGGSLFDPYIRYGVGFASRTFLNSGFGYDRDRDIWTTAEAPDDSDDDDDDDDYDDDYDDDHSHEQIVSAGMYQYLGAGLQCNLSGLVLGVGVNYNILHQRYDQGDYEWDAYPVTRFEARVYGGVAF